MNSAVDKRSVLILGGSGFIGRNLVDFLIKNDLVSRIRVADKVPIQTAWLNSRHQEIFNSPLVEFKSTNLINPTSCQNAFICSEGNFDYVINLAGETKNGQSDPVYKEGIFKLSLNCAKEAAERGVKRYIELSSGQICSSSKTPNKECDKAEPWSPQARFKLMVEDELQQVANLDYVIIRPAIVYGIGDKQGLMPRLIIGAIYKYLGEMMKLLWDKDMKMNTIHVVDLCRAIWHLCSHGKSGEVYNIVDKGNTTQGKISDLISDIFNINHDYLGTTFSALAKADMQSVLDDINDKHLTPWAEACAKSNIVNTPLNPYLDKEMFQHKHIHLDSSKLESTGFTYLMPEVTKEALLQILRDYVQMGIFPSSLMI